MKRQHRTGEQVRATWLRQHQYRLRDELGDSLVAQQTAALATRALVPNTYIRYSEKWLKFERFCKTQGLSALPATKATVALYMGHLAAQRTKAGKRRIQPQSRQGYLSCINKVHATVLGQHDGPARATTNPLLAEVIRGWQLEYNSEPADPTTERIAIPADTVLAIAGEAATRVIKGKIDNELLRCCVATCTGFLLGARPATLAHLRRQDLVLNGSTLTIHVTREKPTRTKKRSRRVVQFQREQLPAALIFLLKKWLTKANQNDMWSLPTDNFTTIAAAWTHYVTSATAMVGHRPPQGFKFTSYSLRKGAATAMHSINVSLGTIRHVGGWARKSSSVWDYIDPMVRASHGAYAFFGQLLPAQFLPSPPPTSWTLRNWHTGPLCDMA